MIWQSTSFKRILAAISYGFFDHLRFYYCFFLLLMNSGTFYDAIDAIDDAEYVTGDGRIDQGKYGYDQPVYIQYIRWLDGLINGNFGYSIVTHQSISADLAIRIPNTIKLILPAYLLAYALAIVMG